MQRIKQYAGITLIELIITIGIFTILVGIVMPVTIGFVRTYSLTSERSTLISLLEWARDQSLANGNQNKHGVMITGNEYVGFVGTSYAARDPVYDLAYPRSGTIIITGPSEVIFEALSGRSSTTTITLDNGDKQLQISINPEGTIDW